MNMHPQSGDPFSIHEVRKRVATKLTFAPDEHDGDHIRNPDYSHFVISNATKPAAVLIPLVERNTGTNVVLTKRTEQLKSHSGQVAFPGGKIDAGDQSPEHAAVREANEEVGLPYDRIEVIGRFPDYYSGSGYKIVPVIGVVDPSVELEANPDEVDHIFEVPLEFLMNPKNHIEASRMFKGSRRYYLEMPYKEHFIWGVTAGIIRVVHDRLYA